MSVNNSKKRSVLWTIVLVLTVALCTTALMLHYKNWVSLETSSIELSSGFYKVAIPYKQLDSVVFVPRIPPMIRLNGFSALAKEKGIFQEFKDSLTEKQVRVFVDNIEQQKIKLVYNDSVMLYVNLKDSVETVQLFNHLSAKATPTVPN